MPFARSESSRKVVNFATKCIETLVVAHIEQHADATFTSLQNDVVQAAHSSVRGKQMFEAIAIQRANQPRILGQPFRPSDLSVGAKQCFRLIEHLGKSVYF
ncbi:hypothetical protein CI15_24600 [Paraburkholderia monticola]|uniref:Uncharacterized protein n=1 Tax=Paraburkholderia monticola TaxID=1399968 RepID=A0A149PFE8_9BURK|nr:hypothetical protein CI15_24600 [Paraburkholderia monticola]